MFSINRIVAVVRPKEPYFEWTASINDGECANDVLSEQDLRTAYLLPESDDAEESLRACFQAIFDAELDSWHRDESAWPTDRSFVEFQRWFDVELTEMVLDMGEGEIEKA